MKGQTVIKPLASGFKKDVWKMWHRMAALGCNLSGQIHAASPMLLLPIEEA